MGEFFLFLLCFLFYFPIFFCNTKDSKIRLHKATISNTFIESCYMGEDQFCYESFDSIPIVCFLSIGISMFQGENIQSLLEFYHHFIMKSKTYLFSSNDDKRSCGWWNILIVYANYIKDLNCQYQTIRNRKRGPGNNLILKSSNLKYMVNSIEE